MEEGPEQRPSPGAAEALGHLACSRGGQAVGTSRGRGGGGEQGCREGHTGKVPLEGQKGAGARRWDTQGKMAQAPTEVVLEVEVPSCLTGGEGPSPALSPPPPCEGGPQIQEPRWLPAPGVSTCLCPMRKQRFLLLAPRASTHHPPQPHRGHRCLFPNPLESDRDGDPSAQEPELGGQGETPFSQLSSGRGDRWGLHPKGQKQSLLSFPGAPCAFTVTPNHFISPKAAFSRCCRSVTDALDRKWGNREKQPPPSPP